MSKEKSPRQRLHELLKERGIDYWCAQGVTFWNCEDGRECLAYTYDADGTEKLAMKVLALTPEQAIAATVGDKHKDNQRNYKPNGEPKIPNMSVGADPDWVDWVASLEHKKPSGLTEAVQQLMFEVICFGGEMGPNDCGGENCPDEGMVYTEGFIRGWVEKISAMIGRSCASCPEMGNPDSYISHLQSALKWHDEHVPRPTNPRNTCVVLKGERPPEEVLFVRDGGGVTHYLPEDVSRECQAAGAGSASVRVSTAVFQYGNLSD